MTAHSTYVALRQFADSWGLFAMVTVFVVLAAWPFRPGAKSANEEAARIIFRDDDNG